jgi:hypothetical protein
MSKTETVNLTISAAEVRSISEVASITAETIQSFAEKEKIAESLEKIENELVNQEENKAEGEEQDGQKALEQKKTEPKNNEQELEPEEQETTEPKEQAEEEQ